MEKNEVGQVKERIRFKEKLAFGLGDIASSVVWTSVGSFLTYYYTDSVGIAANTAALIFLLSRFLDGISDILMGLIIDRTKSKHGKARPWLLWMAVPYFLSTVFLFSVPNIGVTGKIIYAFITYNLISTVVYTAINLPYGLINTLATDNAKDRVSMNVFRMFGAIIMGTISNVVIMPLVSAVGGEQGSRNPLAWTIVMGGAGLISMILFFICFKGTKERIKPVKKERVPFSKAFPAMLKNKYWYLCLINGIFTAISTNMMGANVYFAKYWLKNENAVGLISLAQMPTMIVGLILGAVFAGKIGKRNTVRLGAIIISAGLVVILVAPSVFLMTILGTLIRGFGLGLMSSSSLVLMSDAIDYGEWKTGIRSDGLLASAASFGTKIGTGLGAAIIGWGLAIGGYAGGVDVQSKGAMAAILILFAGIPLVVSLTTILLMSFYDLDKKLPQIHKEMRERHAEAEAAETAAETEA